ncbi:hypothetical protein BH24ACT3_BH24ACT3_16220 [soil metagenome]
MTAAVLAGVAVAALGALMLGEYEFVGFMPFVGGPLFGLVVAEVVAGIGKHRGVAVALLTGVVSAAGLLWAGWLAASEGLVPMSALVWPAMALGAAAAAIRLWPRRWDGLGRELSPAGRRGPRR